MAQIPALFLPKKPDGDKVTVKSPSKKRHFKKKEEKQTQRIATLLT
jgi:hypothetical protein